MRPMMADNAWIPLAFGIPCAAGTTGDDRGGDWGSVQNWPLEPAEGGPLPEDPRLRRMWKNFWGMDFSKLERSNRKNVVSGAWRVEVSPTLSAEEDRFLHVLEIG